MNRLLVAGALAAFLAAVPWPATAKGDAAQATIAAAKKGDASAQYKLGEMYDLGKGVPQDFRQAVKWYRLSAQQGNASAQFALAEMYKNGDGVEKDLGEAVRWYRRAADQGNAGAQLLLGVLYESGVGVSTDLTEAATWYRRSADQGDARAQLLLGNLYQLGQGVPRSTVVAYALYSVSARRDAKGNPALDHRATLARGMSPGDLEAARKLSEEMSRPGNFGRALDQYLAQSMKP